MGVRCSIFLYHFLRILSHHFCPQQSFQISFIVSVDLSVYHTLSCIKTQLRFTFLPSFHISKMLVLSLSCLHVKHLFYTYSVPPFLVYLFSFLQTQVSTLHYHLCRSKCIILELFEIVNYLIYVLVEL